MTWKRCGGIVSEQPLLINPPDTADVDVLVDGGQNKIRLLNELEATNPTWARIMHSWMQETFMQDAMHGFTYRPDNAEGCWRRRLNYGNVGQPPEPRRRSHTQQRMAAEQEEERLRDLRAAMPGWTLDGRGCEVQNPQGNGYAPTGYGIGGYTARDLDGVPIDPNNYDAGRGRRPTNGGGCYGGMRLVDRGDPQWVLDRAYDGTHGNWNDHGTNDVGHLFQTGRGEYGGGDAYQGGACGNGNGYPGPSRRR